MFLFVNFCWVISFNKPWIISMPFIKFIILLFFVLDNIIIVSILNFKLIKLYILIIFKIFFGKHWFIERRKSDFLRRSTRFISPIFIPSIISALIIMEITVLMFIITDLVTLLISLLKFIIVPASFILIIVSVILVSLSVRSRSWSFVSVLIFS